MSKRSSNLLLAGFLIGFFFLGYIAFQKALPETKDERVYEALKPYFPYTIEQRLGGFTIVYRPSGDKEKPPASEFFKRIDEVDKKWGKTHLKVEGSNLIIMDKTQKQIAKISLKNKNELDWVKKFFNK